MDFATITGIIEDIAGFIKDFAAKITLFIEGLKSKKYYDDEVFENLD